MPADHQKMSPLEQWFLDVPAHWDVLRLGSLGELTSGATPARDEPTFWGGEVPWVSPKDMKSPSLSDSLERTTEDALRRTGLKLIPHPAILFVVRGMILAHTFPVARTLAPVTMNQDMKALRLRPGVVPRYIAYLFSGCQARILAEVQEAGHGTRRLPMEAWKNLKIGLPPPREQEAIANLLDRETAKIDRLIEQKERLIELLQEKRTALITRAVTRGLEPGVETRDSGVDWLGEIPSHWNVAPLYSRYEVALGKMLDSSKNTGETPRPYIRNVDVQWHSVNVENLPKMDFGGNELRRYRLVAGDVLVCEGGEVGRAALWHGELDECFYQKAVHRLRPHSPQESPAFFVFVMEAAARAGVFVAGSNPNTIHHLTAVQLRHHRFAFPPYGEQKAIAEFLVQQDRSMRQLMTGVEQAITLLREYRTALISAAVTGKIGSPPEGVAVWRRKVGGFRRAAGGKV